MDPQASVTMKSDCFGRVERVGCATDAAVLETFVRRVASGGRIPGSGIVARRLLARERRALVVLDSMPGVPSLRESPPHVLPENPRRELHRSWLEGVPLYAADVLPEDFFERLEDLVRALHARGVCHNDLHKEGNIIVAPWGAPFVIDFQLASLHPRFGRSFEIRASEDLRHVAKHQLRYLAAGAWVSADPAVHHRRERSRLAAVWLRYGKPVYNFVTRRVLRTSDGEPHRKASDPWPRWGPALGPLPAAGEKGA